MSCYFPHNDYIYNQCLHQDNYVYDVKNPARLTTTYYNKSFVMKELRHFEYLYYAIPEPGTTILYYELIGDVVNNLKIDKNTGLIHGYIDHTFNQNFDNNTDNTPLWLSGNNHMNNGRPLDKAFEVSFQIRVHWFGLPEFDYITADRACVLGADLYTGERITSYTDKVVKAIFIKEQDFDNYIWVSKIVNTEYKDEDRNSSTYGVVLMEAKTEDFDIYKHNNIALSQRIVPDVDPLLYTNEDVERKYNPIDINDINIDPIEFRIKSPIPPVGYEHPAMKETLEWVLDIKPEGITLDEIRLVYQVLKSTSKRPIKDRIRQLLNIPLAPGCCDKGDINATSS